MTDPTYYLPLAKAAEDAGYHAMTIADSIAYPFESDSTYPYTPDGNREFLDGKAFVEAFVLAGALCAVTTTTEIRLLRPQAAHPPARVGGQAGRVACGGLRQPPRPRRRHQPVAGGLRTAGCPVREARQADGRMHRHHQGPDIRRLLRVSRRVLRHPEDQDDARPVRADPDPDRRARRGRAAQGGALRRLDARRQRAQGTRPAHQPAERDPRRGGPHRARSRSTSCRPTPTPPTASSGWRTRV